MSTKKLKVGIIGCGGIARAHAAAYGAVEGVEVASVYDVSESSAAALAKEIGATVAESLDAMIEDGLDAVSNCTPPGVHLGTCLPFVKAGIPILCEKPLEATDTTARRLAEAVRRRKVPFMTAFCHRFHPPIVAMKNLIDKGELGEPLLFRNIFTGHLDLKPNHRSRPELSGGGTMIDNGTHSVDLFRFLVGDPTEVNCMTATIRQKVNVEDFGAMILSARGKCFGELVACHSTGVGRGVVEWHGTKGSAILDYSAGLSYQVQGKGSVFVDCVQEPNRFTAEVQHFVGCVRNGRKPAVTEEDGLKASRVISAAYRAAKERRTVRIRL